MWQVVSDIGVLSELVCDLPGGDSTLARALDGLDKVDHVVALLKTLG